MNKGTVPIDTEWVVVTGGPSSGKTTTIDHFKSLGFSTSPETARALIDIGIQSGLTTAEIRRDESVFNLSVLNIQIALENILIPDRLLFFDRAIPDQIAYIRLSGGDESWVREAALKRRYHFVFLLDLLQFKKDYARTEDEKIAKYIDKLITEVYEELGYKVVRVPVLTIEERSTFILKSLNMIDKIKR